ncbi:MAG: hypothetical protein ACXACT_17695, partial [Candidatus Thorarchaeota archaeon]
MADFATDDPRLVLKSMEEAKQLAQALRDGKVPEVKRLAAEQSLRNFRVNMDPETGADTTPREVDGTPRIEFADKIGMSRDIGQEGARQLLSMTKGLGNFTYDTALTALDLANAVGADGGEFEGGINELRAQARDAQRQFNADANDMVIRVTGAEPSGFGEFVGATLPFFAVPTALSTYTRTVAFNALVGAAGGAILTPEAENFQDRVGDMTVGALMGVGTSALLSAKSGFESFASRRMMKRFEEDLARANKELEGQIQGITGDFDFNFSMGQITADPFIGGLEFGAAHKIQRAAQNSRIKTLVDFMDKRSKGLSQRGDTEQIAIDLNDTMKRISKETLDAAGDNYARGIDDLIESYGDEVVLDARGYLDKTREMAGELADPRHLGTQRSVPDGLREHIRYLDDRINPFKSVRKRVKGSDGKTHVVYEMRNKLSGEVVETFTGRGAQTKALSKVEVTNLEQGGLDVDDLAEILKGNRRIASGEQPIFESIQLGSQQNLAAALKGALLESMDGSSSGAIGALKNVRGQYAQEMNKLNNISNTMLGRVFGDESAIFSADEALDRLIGRSPQSLKATREILQEWNPGLLDDIKAVTIRRAVERSRNPGTQASLIETDLTMLANNLAGKSKGVGELGLKETHVDQFTNASASRIQDATINVISRSPEFMARFIARVVSTGSSLEHIINDPGARKSILWLANR